MREIVKADYRSRVRRCRETGPCVLRRAGEPFRWRSWRGLAAPTVSTTARATSSTSARPHVRRPPAQGLEAPLRPPALLARDEKPDAPADHGTAWLTQGGARQAPLALEEARSATTASSGGSSTCSTSTTSPRRAVLLPGGMVLVRELEKVRARVARRPRLQRSRTAPRQQELWEQSGTGLLQENMFKFGRGGRSLQPEADELPGVGLRVQAGAALLPRPAVPTRRWAAATATSGRAPLRARAVRSSPDDAHLYLRPGAAPGRDHRLARPGARVVRHLQLQPSYRLAKRPPDKLGTEQSVGPRREEALHQRCARLRSLRPHKGAAPSTGPKIDIDVEAARPPVGARTIQVDLTMLPERMALRVHRHDGQAKRPVVIPPRDLRLLRAVVAILTEHFRGGVPHMGRPVQRGCSPDQRKARRVRSASVAALRAARIRAELDDRNEKPGLPHPATPRFARCPTCWSWGAGAQTGPRAWRRRTGEDWRGCRWSASWPSSSPRSQAVPATLTVGRAG